MSDTDEALRVRFEICNALLQSEDGSKHGCNDWTARSAKEKHRSGGGGGGCPALYLMRLSDIKRRMVKRSDQKRIWLKSRWRD